MTLYSKIKPKIIKHFTWQLVNNTQLASFGKTMENHDSWFVNWQRWQPLVSNKTVAVSSENISGLFLYKESTYHRVKRKLSYCLCDNNDDKAVCILQTFVSYSSKPQQLTNSKKMLVMWQDFNQMKLRFQLRIVFQTVAPWKWHLGKIVKALLLSTGLITETDSEKYVLHLDDMKNRLNDKRYHYCQYVRWSNVQKAHPVDETGLFECKFTNQSCHEMRM